MIIQSDIFAERKYRARSDGFIGEEIFVGLMNNPHIDDMLTILETPNEEIWKKKIKFLYRSVEG
ncbi:MAG: hypothetical protein GH151_13340 [Bacteroidetes bacterium]|nr:hypothetical protein [Bacteroidota bacterium]